MKQNIDRRKLFLCIYLSIFSVLIFLFEVLMLNNRMSGFLWRLSYGPSIAAGLLLRAIPFIVMSTILIIKGYRKLGLLQPIIIVVIGSIVLYVVNIFVMNTTPKGQLENVMTGWILLGFVQSSFFALLVTYMFLIPLLFYYKKRKIKQT